MRECQLVLIDYHMPGLNGGDVLESLQTSAESLGVKPLFYLYTTDGELIPKARQLGFDGTIENKGNVEATLQQIDALFRLTRLRQLRKS
jgi:DNA-binding NarL/FixJ family response regulator